MAARMRSFKGFVNRVGHNNHTTTALTMETKC